MNINITRPRINGKPTYCMQYMRIASPLEQQEFLSNQFCLPPKTWPQDVLFPTKYYDLKMVNNITNDDMNPRSSSDVILIPPITNAFSTLSINIPSISNPPIINNPPINNTSPIINLSSSNVNSLVFYFL